MPERQSDSIWFNEDGTWKSVELATMHAIVVQGGFTTEKIEATRMLSEPANATMGQAWLDANPDAV